MAGALPHIWLFLRWCCFFSASEGPTTPQCPVFDCLQHAGNPNCSFPNLEPYGFLGVLLNSLLRRRCTLRPRSLMPLLHLGPFHIFFSNVPFRVSCSTLSLVESFLMKFPLRRTTLARRVIYLPAANSCRVPQSPWVQTVLRMFLLRPATVTLRDTFLQAAAKLLRDSQSARVSFFGSPRLGTNIRDMLYTIRCSSIKLVQHPLRIQR
jgi:hypothetical protein